MEEKKLKDQITLKHLSDDFVSLNRNGSDLFCPFVPPMMFQQPQKSGIMSAGNQPQVGYSRSSCTSLCPLFKILDGGKKVKLNCGTTVEYDIEKIIPIEESIKPQGEGKILKMDKDVN